MRLPVVTAWATGSVLLAMCSWPAAADPIRLVRDNRAVLADALAFRPPGFVADSSRQWVLEGGDDLSASARAEFGDTVSRTRARMTSVFAEDLHRFAGVGHTSSDVAGPMGHASGTAYFEVWFDVVAPHRYAFDGSFSGTGGAFGSWQAHLAQVVGESSTPQFGFISNTGSVQEVGHRGSLGPGQYVLNVRSDAMANTITADPGVPASRSDYDFSFAMTPVPEPTSLLLLTGGALALVARARRRRSADRSATDGCVRDGSELR
jgi:hypothetical protein